MGAKFSFLKRASFNVPFLKKELIFNIGTSPVEVQTFTFADIASRIHEDAAVKYPAYSWEAMMSEKADSTMSCNLDAILRHTLRFVNHGENVDPESTYPHAWHLICRCEMFLTARMRIDESKMESVFKSNAYQTKADKIRAFDELTRTVTIGQDIAMMPSPTNLATGNYIYVTPEFVEFLSKYLPNDDNLNRFQCVVEEYAATDSYETVKRLWFTRLMAFLEAWPREDISLAYGFAEQLLAFCAVVLYSPSFDPIRDQENWKMSYISYTPAQDQTRTVEASTPSESNPAMGYTLL